MDTQKKGLSLIENRKGCLYDIILSCIGDGKIRKEISLITGISMTTTCARVNELIKAGALYEDGSVKVNEQSGITNLIVKKNPNWDGIFLEQKKFLSQMTKRELYAKINELENEIKKLKGENI